MAHHQWHQSMASILFPFIFAFITHFSSSFPPPHPPMDTHLGIFKVCFFCPSAIHLFGYECIQIAEKAMAPHSSTLAWKIPQMEEPGRLQSMGSWGSDTTERLQFHFSLSCIGEGNGNPLQWCSCLENPRDGGAWWAVVYGVAQSWTRLKWLSSSSVQIDIVKIYIKR